MRTPYSHRCQSAWMIIVLVGLFTLTACGNSDEPVATATPELGVLKIGIDRFAGFAPVYLAEELYYPSYGLEVRPEIIPSTKDRTDELEKGVIDALCTTEDSLLLAAAQGLDLVIVAAVDESAGADGIIAGPGIRDIKSLEGKTVAFQKSMPSHFLLLSALAKERMAASSVYSVPLDAQEAAKAFQAGSVSAAVTWEPWLSRAVEKGKGHLLATSRDFPGLLVDVIAVRRDVFKYRRRAVLALYRGWMQAIDRWKEDPAGSGEVMSRHLNLSLTEFQDNMAGLRLTDRQYNEQFFSRRNAHSAWVLGKSAVRCWRDAEILPYSLRFSVNAHVTDKIVGALWPPDQR